MTAIPTLDLEECYLAAILDDPSGIELAEFSWVDEENDDRCFRVWDYQWCLRGDTVLYTDQGRRQIKDVVGPVRLLTGGTGERGEWVDAGIRYFGQAELWKIDLKRRGVQRSIYATADHRWYAGAGRADRRSYTEHVTSELEPGDYLQPMTSPQVEFKLARHSVQAGIVHGDGTQMHQGRYSLVRLYGEKQQLASWFDREAKPYYGHEASVDAVQINGLPGWYKTDLPVVGEASEAELWGWLAGYFAADGSVLPDGTCQITSTSARSIFHVRDVATALGVVCSAVGHREIESQPPGAKMARTYTEMRVVLRISDLPEKFFLRHSHWLRKVMRGDRPRAIDAWQVTAVTSTGVVEDVYCAEVPNTHSFVLDGDILTGNSWYHNESTFQIDQAGRSLGKSVGITMRAYAFPFNFPGQEMLITAPELNHLRPVTDKVENLFLTTRLGREMLPKVKGGGINHQPQFQARFINGSRIISRLPNRDGRGVKGSVCTDVSVLTSVGHKPVQDVQVGDLVLTHMGRWRPVLHKYEYEADTVTVKGGQLRGITVSTNHRFLARRNRSVCRTRSLAPATWVDVENPELARWYWASPAEVPPQQPPEMPCDITDVRSFLWLAGRYVADGHLGGATAGRTHQTHVGFTDDEAGIILVEQVCGLLGFRALRRQHDNAVCTVINSVELARWFEQNFGRLANGKKIPMWLLGASHFWKSAFLEGYLGGDGHWSEEKGRWEMGTASKELAVGLKILGQSLGYGSGLSWVDPKVTHIGGVELKNKPQRSWRVQMVVDPRGQALFEDDKAWGKIGKVEPAGVQRVFDLVVAEDHSYVGDGIVHLGSAFGGS